MCRLITRNSRTSMGIHKVFAWTFVTKLQEPKILLLKAWKHRHKCHDKSRNVGPCLRHKASSGSLPSQLMRLMEMSTGFRRQCVHHKLLQPHCRQVNRCQYVRMAVYGRATGSTAGSGSCAWQQWQLRCHCACDSCVVCWNSPWHRAHSSHLPWTGDAAWRGPMMEGFWFSVLGHCCHRHYSTSPPNLCGCKSCTGWVKAPAE